MVSSDGNCILSPIASYPTSVLTAYIPLQLVHMVTFILIVVYYRNLSPLLRMLWFAIPNDDLYLCSTAIYMSSYSHCIKSFMLCIVSLFWFDDY